MKFINLLRQEAAWRQDHHRHLLEAVQTAQTQTNLEFNSNSNGNYKHIYIHITKERLESFDFNSLALGTRVH